MTLAPSTNAGTRSLITRMVTVTSFVLGSRTKLSLALIRSWKEQKPVATVCVIWNIKGKLQRNFLKKIALDIVQNWSKYELWTNKCSFKNIHIYFYLKRWENEQDEENHT